MCAWSSLTRKISTWVWTSNLKEVFDDTFLNILCVKMLCNFIEITLWHGCSPTTLLYVFRTPFPKNTSGRLLLKILIKLKNSNLNLQYSLKFNSSTVVLSLILRVLHLIRTNMPLSYFKRTFLERMISFTWNEC